jgi:signal transduction histidine kinase
MERAGEEKPFNLIRWFSIVSFVCIVFISSFSAFLLSRFLTHNILQRDAVVTMDFVQSHTEAENAAFFFEEADPGMAREYFEDLFKHVLTMPEVVRVNVYDKEGNVLWSDDERLIGHNFMPNPDLITGLTGTLAITSGTSGKPMKGEHVFDKEVPFFAEIYIPIWNNSKGRVVGVFEVYKEPLMLFNTIQKGNRLIWASAVLGGLFLYVFLFWIVRRADKTIRRQQGQLLESQTSALVGEMTSAVAHGIRNPLASIRSSAEVALEQARTFCESNCEPRSDRYTAEEALEESPLSLFTSTSNDIIAEADRLSGWIKELLAYAHISRGTFIPIQINDLIRSALVGPGEQMAKRGIKSIFELEEALPHIDADELPLNQMFISLISNAIEAMPEGGEITVRTRFIKEKAQVNIIIMDTGKGIPKDKLEKVFTPFFTTKSKGIGVGLSLAKRIMDRHHGTIQLESRESVGTTVSLQIPISK